MSEGEASTQLQQENEGQLSQNEEEDFNNWLYYRQQYDQDDETSDQNYEQGFTRNWSSRDSGSILPQKSLDDSDNPLVGPHHDILNEMGSSPWWNTTNGDEDNPRHQSSRLAEFDYSSEYENSDNENNRYQREFSEEDVSTFKIYLECIQNNLLKK
jgi:hypothetical protein